MDLSVSKADLSRALQVTLNAVAKRTTMPVLSNILLSAGQDELKISASDLEISALATIPAQVKSAGSTTVNARVFGDVVRELPDGEVKITLGEGERIEIVTKGSRFKINGMSAEEYPSLPGLGYEVSGRMPTKMMKEMIARTLYAASLDETRFNLNGVCFEITGAAPAKGKGKKAEAASTLRMVATDGHRLAMISRPCEDFSFEGRVIVPRKGLAEVKKILEAETEPEVRVAITEGFFLLQTKEFKISMRLIDGEYPDYSQVIPQEQGKLAVVKCADLSQALRRVMLMVTDREKCVRMTFGEDTLRIASSSPELGEASEELPVNYNGALLTVGFNATYVLDVVTALGDEGGLVGELHGELGPGRFYLENDESSMAIVMPMRL